MRSRAVKLTMKNNFFKPEKRINAIIAVSKENSSHDVVRVNETRNNTCSSCFILILPRPINLSAQENRFKI